VDQTDLLHVKLTGEHDRDTYSLPVAASGTEKQVRGTNNKSELFLIDSNYKLDKMIHPKVFQNYRKWYVLFCFTL